MKLLSFINPQTGEKSWGCVEGNRVYDLRTHFLSEFTDLKSVIAAGALSKLGAIKDCKAAFTLDEVHFLPVIENPNKIFCAGMNYQEKRIEFEQATDAPTLFIRFPDSLSAHGEEVCKPKNTNEFDYEGELAVVIGKPADAVPFDRALEYVAGYSCFMDGSVRDMQYSWFTSGKNWRRTGAFGPWLVTADEVKDPQDLLIKTWLNGQQVQSESTKNMIYSVAFLIEYISRFSPLSAGDVIITGSPGGVGKKRVPPLFMHEGDTIEVEISCIGRLVNRVSSLSNTLVNRPFH